MFEDVELVEHRGTTVLFGDFGPDFLRSVLFFDPFEFGTLDCGEENVHSEFVLNFPQIESLSRLGLWDGWILLDSSIWLNHNAGRDGVCKDVGGILELKLDFVCPLGIRLLRQLTNSGDLGRK